MNRKLLALLLVLLVILGALVLQLLPPKDRSGWTALEGGTGYLDPEGNPIAGWYRVDGTDYYFTPEKCTLHTGWAYRNGSPCYTRQGQVVTGWLETDRGRHYLDPDGALHTGWLETEEGTWYLTEEGTCVRDWYQTDRGLCWFDSSGRLCTGLVTTDRGLYCFAPDGTPRSGWVELDGKYYCFRPDGSACSGWVELDGIRRYLTEEGPAAVGRLELDGQVYWFTSTGREVTLVNRWNPLPEDYKPDYVYLEGHAVDPACREALAQMLADCRAAGNRVHILSAYRSYRDQGFNFNNALWARIYRGMTKEEATADAMLSVALPGTSEHQLGLAVDLVDSGCPQLEQFQESLPAQQWLMENCWNYGFILRYPSGTTAVTGITYEPWHYRYVGTELSLELKELGLCLEEYLDSLNPQAPTAGDPTRNSPVPQG